jgi:ribosomal protein S6--L-glutamate ligase
MRIVTFDAFRSLGIPGTQYIKPDLYQQQLAVIKQADWILFPEYWQVNSLHYALGLNIYPSLSSYHIGHNKIEQTRAFQLVCPYNTPDTLILENSEANASSIWEYFAGSFVAKLPKSSEGRGVFLIESRADWRTYCAQSSVLYAQELLPIDRDMRIVIIGDKVIGGYWRRQSNNGFHNNIAQGGSLDFAPLHPHAVTAVLNIARSLKINHGGFDVAMVGDRPYILEFNRLFGNHGLIEQGVKPAAHIFNYLQDAYQPGFTPPYSHPQAV